jgi:Zyg-11 protein homolog
LDINDNFINVFKDINRTPLKFVSLRNSSITDEGMRHLLEHKLISLSLWYCDKMTHASWQPLIANGDELRNLELGKLVDMLKNREPNEKTPLDFQLQLPKLRRLVLNGVALQSSVTFSHLHELTYLDLTACLFADFSLESLTYLPQLQTLILFNVWPLDREIKTICKLKGLRTLDISLSKSMMPSYKDPDRTLDMIVSNLPYLEHLDISGTNL